MTRISTLFLVCATIGLSLNLIFWENIIVGSVASLIYLVLLAQRSGDALCTDDSPTVRTLLGFFFTTAIVLFLGTVLFYVWQLDTTALVLITLLTPLIITRLRATPSHTPSWVASIKGHYSHWLTNPRQLFSHVYQPVLMVIYLLLVGALFSQLGDHQTIDAIRSPWEVVPSTSLILYFSATLVLLCLAWIKKPSEHTSTSQTNIMLILSSLHLFLTFSVTVLVYGVNFGFDPFVHQASEKLLATTGTISPKPLLYLGHYSLVVWLSNVSSINMLLIDRLLVPVLAALLLPATLYYGFKKTFGISECSIYTAIIAFPILLLPFFFSVPQNLGNLFLLITIFTSLPYLRAHGISSSRRYALLWFLSIATFFIHPFSGVPALIYSTLVTARHYTGKGTHLLFAILALGSTVALPAALILGSGISGNTGARIPLSDSLFSLSDIAQWVPFHSTFHTIELFASNHILLIILTVCMGVWFLYHLRQRHLVTLFLTATAIIVLDIIILTQLPIPIISYELEDFITRFWNIALLFLVPLALLGVSVIAEKAHTAKHTYTLLPLVFFLALFTTASFYVLYPRIDTFAKSRAFATSVHDITAVQWIEEDAAGVDYIVLSNQAVAAAALQELGFKQYYTDTTCQTSDLPAGRHGDRCQELFFYPIPTTSPLYQTYLDMVYDFPSKTRLEDAMHSAGVQTGYFVINDYWLDAEKRVTQAHTEFTTYKNINNGAVHIFKHTTQ